ncbi:septal ring lytic transglycosylase RlpA family protein [Modicisalibacter xianhensis]|uniref:Endolytic peptidoglycan transglycosylase RlpA n=1 Tax=Modicisalibacter xianhensis TaxID=442341 RepID=A0A1I3CU92_9GAMM|nr:septal ring lytic transglycosylase RlpA family protein [Halomonas xianhensis]SFH77918.1 rare lipoprotein A [Halomonas xianhensis]
MKTWLAGLSLASVALFLGGCASHSADPGQGAYTAQQGQAAYYSDAYQGNRTANGERYDRNALTAAHRSLPFGTRVNVTNLNNGRNVTVRINDRGPFTRGRIIDLSRRAAQQLGMIRSGTAPVRVIVLN